MNPTWWWNAIGFLPKVSPFVYFKKLKFGPSREAGGRIHKRGFKIGAEPKGSHISHPWHANMRLQR
jgi:hypothetical protein